MSDGVLCVAGHNDNNSVISLDHIVRTDFILGFIFGPKNRKYIRCYFYGEHRIYKNQNYDTDLDDLQLTYSTINYYSKIIVEFHHAPLIRTI